MTNKIQIYTDGACSGNPGPGGWAAVLLSGAHRKEISGFEQSTTNNRMELVAVIRGLESIKFPRPPMADIMEPIEVLADSAYVVNAINQGWITNWQRNDWITSTKEPVKNRDLWEQLIALNAKLKPRYIKVKGHSDNVHNNRADELAVAEIKKNT